MADYGRDLGGVHLPFKLSCSTFGKSV